MHNTDGAIYHKKTIGRRLRRLLSTFVLITETKTLRSAALNKGDRWPNGNF